MVNAPKYTRGEKIAAVKKGFANLRGSTADTHFSLTIVAQWAIRALNGGGLSYSRMARFIHEDMTPQEHRFAGFHLENVREGKRGVSVVKLPPSE